MPIGFCAEHQNFAHSNFSKVNPFPHPPFVYVVDIFCQYLLKDKINALNHWALSLIANQHITIFNTIKKKNGKVSMQKCEFYNNKHKTQWKYIIFSL